MKRHNISFSDPQDEYLRTQSDARGISLAEYVRRIIDEHIERQKKATQP